MDLKETKPLKTSAEIKLHTKSGQNKSNTQAIYDTLFSEEEKINESNTGSKYLSKDIQKPTFGNVSTLEWITTWRAYEIN